MSDEWIPIILFISVAVVLVAGLWMRLRARDAMQQTIRLALDKGHELTPEIIDRLGHPKANKYKDLRLGIVWLAIAVGLALIAVVVPDPSGNALRGTLAGAALPFAIGAGYLVMYWFTGRED